MVHAEPAWAIEIEDLHKAFGSQRVLRGVTLRVRTGAIVTIVGRSGGGKSVLLKHVVGLLRPDRGRVRVDGVDVTGARARALARVRRRFGVVFQGGALFDSMSVEDNVAFPLREHTRLGRAEIRARVDAILEELELDGIHRKYPAELSGGMRKRVALARAIVMEPAIVLYDEPTTGLDPLTAEQVRQLIVRTHRRHGMTGLVVSHDLPGALATSDEIAVLHEGRIVQQTTPAHLLAEPHPAARALLTAAFRRTDPA